MRIGWDIQEERVEAGEEGIRTRRSRRDIRRAGVGEDAGRARVRSWRVEDRELRASSAEQRYLPERK